MLNDPEKIWEYAQRQSTHEDELLYTLYRETNLKTVYPNMLSGNLQGQLLKLFSCMIQPNRILEIGTFTGYSAICMARGLREGGLLHTIDINDELTEIANRFFRLAGLEHQIISHTGDALSIVPELNELFDLAFIDGDKEEYSEYYGVVFPKIRKGGIILADNVLWGGKVLAGDADKETSGIRAFNALIARDDRVEKLLLPFRDGIYILRKL
jgi:predicted O-methyltransferase YrrM